MFALNMIDGDVQCYATETIHAAEGDLTKQLRPRLLPTRLVCDPFVYFRLAESACSTAKPFDMRLRLISWEPPDASAREIVDVDHFCSRSLSYSIFHANSWIHSPGDNDLAPQAGTR